MNRIESIKEYLRKNEELIEEMAKGKIEINFNGNRLLIKTIEYQEEVKVNRGLDKIF